MLGRTDGEERTLSAALEAGDWGMVFTMRRWIMTTADEGAPPEVAKIE